MPLFFLVLFLGISVRLRLALLASYLLLGLLALSLAPLGSQAAVMAGTCLPITVIFPLGFFLLFTRLARPLVLVIIAIFLYFVGGTALLWPLAPKIRSPGPTEFTNMIVFGIVGILFLGWVLWRRKWRLPVVCLGLLSA